MEIKTAYRIFIDAVYDYEERYDDPRRIILHIDRLNLAEQFVLKEIANAGEYFEFGEVFVYRFEYVEYEGKTFISEDSDFLSEETKTLNKKILDSLEKIKELRKLEEEKAKLEIERQKMIRLHEEEYVQYQILKRKFEK